MGRGAELLSKIIRGGKATDSASEATVDKMAVSYEEGMRAHIGQEIPNVHVHAVQCNSKGSTSIGYESRGSVART